MVVQETFWILLLMVPVLLVLIIAHAVIILLLVVVRLMTYRALTLPSLLVNLTSPSDRERLSVLVRLTLVEVTTL